MKKSDFMPRQRISLLLWILASVGTVLLCRNTYSREVVPGELVLAARAYPEPGKVVASVIVPEITSVREDVEFGLTVRVQTHEGKTIAQASQKTTAGMREEVILDLAEAPPGEYEVTATLGSAAEKQLVSSRTSLTWPGRSKQFSGIRVLNNLVWELLNEEAQPNRPLAGEYKVCLPFDRWLLVRTTVNNAESGRVRVSLRRSDGEVLLTEHSPGQPVTLEAMRFVKAGEHILCVTAEGGLALKHLVVRAVPEIQHSRFPTSVLYVNQGVQYDWGFLQQHILPHVNTIITSGPDEDAIRHLSDWKQMGGKIIVYTGRPGLHGKKELEATPEVCADYWASQPGYALPFSDGILVDEFYHKDDPAYPVYTDAVKLLHTRFPHRSFYPYAAGNFGKDEGSIAFAAACIESGGYICWEAYIAEWPTLKVALNRLREYPYQHVIPFEEKLPGVTKKLIWVPGVFSFPWPYADGYAHVNYNAYLDMQFQFIATHPALFGLGGIHIWRSGYCDEERLRWCGRLFRHYAIEGATSRLGHDPYLLDHIQNPDFVEGEKGWGLTPAAQGSIYATQEKGFGRFIGRYYRGPDTFLVMQRHTERPNIIRQVIRNLQPGRLYSVKAFTGNYDAFQRGDSVREVHAVSLVVEGAEVLSGPQYRYQQLFPTRENMGTFTSSRPFWLNYHWLVFRANAPTAALTISDWKTPTEPGAPTGQSLLLTFVEVKPYLD